MASTNDNFWMFAVLGLFGYWYFTRSGVSSNILPQPYPRQTGWPNQSVTPGRQPTGSGGVTAGSGSVNPFPGGSGAGPTGSGGVVGYITCPDGTLVNDESLCAGGQGMITCWDGSITNDPSLCPNPVAVDTMDPCDPSSSMYDPNQCGTSVSYIPPDSGDPCDPASYAYDPNMCGTAAGYL